MSEKRSEYFDASSSFFDRNVAAYSVGGDLTPEGLHLAQIEFMKNNGANNTFLDVGAGPGRFARFVKLHLPGMQVTALDSSAAMLSAIEDRSIRKIVGEVPDLNLDPGETFSFIHVSYVLHHLVGKTIKESRNAVKESLLALADHLDDSGFLLIEDEYWETYLVPTSSRTLAFLLMAFASKFNIALPPSFSHFHLQDIQGLKVCMYTTSELESILKECRFEIVQFKIQPYSDLTPRKIRWKRLAFLKKWGRVLFIVRKANTS